MCQPRSEFQSIHEIGAVVCEHDDAPVPALVPMTIEAITPSRFGDVARCVWFGHDEQLRYAEQPVRRLDVFPHPVVRKHYGVRDEVRLRPNGPVMTVVGAETEDHSVLCEWDGPKGMVRRRTFPSACLTASMLAA